MVDLLMGQQSVVEARLDALEGDVARIRRRTGWNWRAVVVCAAMALAAIGGSYKASQYAVHASHAALAEQHARELEACQQRVEGRDGIRTLILAVLPLTPSTGPAHKTLSDLLSTSLAPLPPCT